MGAVSGIKYSREQKALLGISCSDDQSSSGVNCVFIFLVAVKFILSWRFTTAVAESQGSSPFKKNIRR